MLKLDLFNKLLWLNILFTFISLTEKKIIRYIVILLIDYWSSSLIHLKIVKE